MKKAIAMKCTQEQFDAIKDKLSGFKIIERVTYFHTENYLVNCFRRNVCTNLNRDLCLAWTANIHETWNEEIFLNACGIETERIFKGSEMQYRKHRGYWIDCDSFDYYEYRIKPDNLIKKQELENQILELQNQLKNL